MATIPCGQQRCRAYRLTVSEYEELGGERWTQAFRVALGKRATQLHREIYGKRSPNGQNEWRNTVRTYPCGILEQAYRALEGREVSAGASGINQWPPIPNPRDHRNLLRKREAFLSKDEDVEQVKLLIGLDKALRLALFQRVVSHAVAASFS